MEGFFFVLSFFVLSFFCSSWVLLTSNWIQFSSFMNLRLSRPRCFESKGSFTIREIAAQSGKNVAKVKADYREAGRRDQLVSMIIEDKVLDIIEGKAKITDGPAEASAETEGAQAEGGSEGEKAPKKKKAKKA